jgi:hypothetical protein
MKQGSLPVKRLVTVCVLPLILLFLIPSQARADASVVQDSCITVGIVPPYNVWTYFTVVNFSLPAPVCDIHFIPEPMPVLPRCRLIDLHSPAGWLGQLNASGGADWIATTPADCIPVGSAKGEFAFLLDPDFCCYVVQFTGPAGEILLEQEECFTCQKVPVDESTWGHIKQLYE